MLLCSGAAPCTGSVKVFRSRGPQKAGILVLASIPTGSLKALRPVPAASSPSRSSDVVIKSNAELIALHLT